MDGYIREEFMKAMNQFDFLNVFFDDRNRNFFPICRKDVLTMDDIRNLTQDSGVTKKTPDKGMMIQVNEIRIFNLCNKWVLCYRHTPIPVKTKYQMINRSCIVVYSDISKEVADDLPNHASFDRDMPCWRY